MPLGKKASSYRGAYRVPLSNLSVVMCVRVCDIEFVVFTDCESCTRPISTNPGYMEAGEDGRTRGTCSVARRPEVVAVAGLLWIYFVVGFGCSVRFRVFCCRFLDFERTHPTASMRPPCLIYLSASNEARPRERSN